MLVIGFGAGQLQKLGLKLLKSRVDTCQGLVIFVTEDGDNIVLQCGEETVLVAQDACRKGGL